MNRTDQTWITWFSRVVEILRNIKVPGCRKVTVKVKVFDNGRPGVQEKVQFVVDFGVTKSLLREEEWHKLRMPANGTRKLELKLNTKEFRIYGTGLKLKILGRTKYWMQAEC